MRLRPQTLEAIDAFIRSDVLTCAYFDCGSGAEKNALLGICIACKLHARALVSDARQLLPQDPQATDEDREALDDLEILLDVDKEAKMTQPVAISTQSDAIDDIIGTDKRDREEEDMIAQEESAKAKEDPEESEGWL